MLHSHTHNSDYDKVLRGNQSTTANLAKVGQPTLWNFVTPQLQNKNTQAAKEQISAITDHASVPCTRTPLQAYFFFPEIALNFHLLLYKKELITREIYSAGKNNRRTVRMDITITKILFRGSNKAAKLVFLYENFCQARAAARVTDRAR